MKIKTDSRGQVLAIVIILLLVVTTLVPVMVMYAQREAVWTAKQSANTSAFHLAEAGIEKGYLAISLSTKTWVDLQNGTALTNYQFNTSFSDLNGGTYAISITSGPLTQQATIISVGRDQHRRETRAVRAVYTNSPLGGVAIFAGAGAQIGGGVNVEWGAVVSPGTVDADGRDYPQFWSASQITGFDTNSDPANCDEPNCCQWHSFSPNIPPNPTIDLTFYKSSAAATTGCPGTGADIDGNPLAGSCYYTSGQSWTSETLIGKTIYIEGDLSLNSPGMDIVGNLIVKGNLNLPVGAWGKGTHTMFVPQDAWKQYCQDDAWDHYHDDFDPASPATFPGKNATYLSAANLTASSNKLAVSGMLYVQGNFNNGGGGGGQSDLYGVLYSVGSTTQTAASGVTFYYSANAAKNIQTTKIMLNRESWQDSLYGWPSWNLP
ncbi:MAG: hypothetical protein AAB320_09240 [Elusimicrobiota bacterium]